MKQRGRLERAAPSVAAAALIALGLYRYGAILRGLGSTFPNFQVLHGTSGLNDVADSRLNSWILAWVEHAAATGHDIWNSNAFHPAENMLAGSEHLFGVLFQLLPVLPLAPNAVALHEIALVLSSAILCLTTYRAVEWATSSSWAAFLAAAFTLMMPWRVSELSHLQLSSAQLFPVIWVIVVRGLLGEARTRDLIVLAVCTAIQLLSSFYLAYFLTISSAVLVATTAALVRPAWSTVGRLAGAVAPGYLLFGLSALPYLERQATTGLASHYDPNFSIGVALASWHIGPQWPYGWATLNQPANYWTPWGVVLLAVVAIAATARTRYRKIEDPAGRRRHTLTWSLAAIVFTSWIMMMGGSLEVLDTRISMPGNWLGSIIPGFSMLRGPSRWGILAAVALPMLAGLGAFAVDRWCGRRITVRIAVAAASALTFAWFQIPTQPAWPAANLIAERYAAVRELPEEGALLELPWSPGPGSIARNSQSVLMSTLHWRPILNGYTGHRPASYRFLQRIGTRLPDPLALEQLRRLTALRFILIDVRNVPAPKLRAWATAAREGRVSLVHSSPTTRIYELRGWQTGGKLTASLLSAESRATTFNGLARTPLALGPGAGRIGAKPVPNLTARSTTTTSLKIHNTSTATWPGFDIDEQGLVRIRYSYIPLGDLATNENEVRDTVTKLAPIEVDLPSGTVTRVALVLTSPRTAGKYELCIDLVQIAGIKDGVQTVTRLPVEPRRQRIHVRGKAAPNKLAELIDSAFVPQPSPPACGTPD